MSLPNKLIPILNEDKTFHESWTKTRNRLNIPHPFRAVLLGKPNCGKGCVAKNLVLRAKPEFEEVIVIHPDSEYTKEWDDIDAQIFPDIPAPDEFPGCVKTLVILDDVELKSLSKDQKSNLDRLYGYVSTHKNISVITCNQDPFSVPPIVRRCSNLWVLWKQDDMDLMKTIARKIGIKSKDFAHIFNTMITDTHDSLWIDLTAKSPYPIRKNGFDLIKKAKK